MGARPWEVPPQFALTCIGGRRTRRGEAPSHPKGGTRDPHALYVPAGPIARGVDTAASWIGASGEAAGKLAYSVSAGVRMGAPKRQPRTTRTNTLLVGRPNSRRVDTALVGHTNEHVGACACNSQVVRTRRESMDLSHPRLPQVVRPTCLGPNGDPFPSLEGETLEGP